jgi:transcriptional regulator with XRE-family HTH domain
MLNPSPNEPQGEPEQAEARVQRRVAAPEVSSAVAPDLDPAWRAGRKLAEARRQRGWTLEEVADRIRIRRDFLAALEEMNVKVLPGKAYTLAFLRSYAKELGIDEKAIVEQFQDENALTRDASVKQMRMPTSKPRRQRPWMGAAIVVLAASAFVGWRAWEANREPAPEVVASAPASGGSGAAPGQEAPLARRVVEVRAVTDGWLETRGPDGTVFLSRTLRAGDVYRPDSSPGWTLHARDGGAFELYVDGMPAGPLGTAGMPVLGRSIDDIQPLAQAQLAQPRT